MVINQQDGNLSVRSLDDGTIELKFVTSTDQQIVARLKGKDVGEIITGLLGASHTSFLYSGKSQLNEVPEAGKLKAIPLSRWMLGSTSDQGQQVLIMQIGEATIGFAVPRQDMRSLARLFIRASYNPESSATSLGLFRDLLRDFVADLRGWVGVFKTSLQTSSRRRAISFSSWISGRSLRIFRTIEVGPDIRVPTYNAIGKCIYCGAEVYSTKPGIRQQPLGGEHIIAEGLGGNLEIPEASCQRCEDATGRFVEGDVLGRTLKALRVHLKLKSRGSGRPPKILPIEATIDGKEQGIEIPIEDYPIVFMMMGYGPYRFVADHVGPGREMYGARVVVLKHNQRDLYRKYKITSFASPYWDNHMLTRMLAKIGHSLATAELGADKYRPMLLELILKGNVTAMSLVGGDPNWNERKISTALHELGLGFQRNKGKTYVVAKIRLFANHGGPVYYAVVGESLQTPIARCRTVLSSRISRMLAR
jgi:hypothetical protein